MIRFLCIFILFAFASDAYSQVNKDDYAGIDSIYISRIGWDVLLDVSVTCTQFEKQGFPMSKIYNKRTIKNICKVISNINNTAENSVNDFRCKIYFFRKDTLISTICCSRYNTNIDGFLYETPDRLVKIMDSYRGPSCEYASQVNLYSEPCVGGIDGIYAYLKSQKSRLLTDRRIRVFVNIEVDKNGSITNIDLRVKNSEIPIPLKETLITILTKEIHWNANPMRVQNEHFTLVFTVEPMNPAL